MALIPMEPEPRPHRWRFVAVYVVLMLITMAIGATGGLLDMWGQP